MPKSLAQLDALIDLLVDVLVREIEEGAQRNDPEASTHSDTPEVSLRLPLAQRCSHAPRSQK